MTPLGPITRMPRFLAGEREDPTTMQTELVAELAAGLLARQASVAPKFLYDALGSRLFEAITELPEYYPTRTEAAIMATHGAAMADVLGRGRALVDLGAGNCEKAEALFAQLQPSRYVAVDIAAAFLEQALHRLQRRHPELDMLGVAMDFSRRLELPIEAGSGPRTLFYPGSSIGNFTPDAALTFLRQARVACAGGGLLIGVDLLKPVAQLERAYDDPLQVTAAFNRNLLLHVNRVLGADFALADWAHAARFNATQSRVEMHLRAQRATTVCWPGGERYFTANETIHTESSYKYQIESFAALLRDAGFVRPVCWTDTRGWFAVFAAVVA